MYPEEFHVNFTSALKNSRDLDRGVWILNGIAYCLVKASHLNFYVKASHLNPYDLLEFENAETLLNSEVFMLLEHRKGQGEADDDQELSEVFSKTHRYTEKFSRYKNRETIATVRRLVVSGR